MRPWCRTFPWLRELTGVRCGAFAACFATVCAVHPAAIAGNATSDLMPAPPRGTLAACSYRANGDEITGLRTTRTNDASSLQCDPAWKRDAMAARRRVSALRADDPRAAEALTCANLLLGLNTASAADAALAASRIAEDAPQSRVLRALGAGARYSLATAPDCKPAGHSEPIPDDVWADMQDKTWHSGMGCPARDDLALLHLPYLDLEGRTRFGEMIVARAVSADVLAAFAQIYAAGSFPISQMRRVDAFDGNDLRSMEANNTSAFNCRLVQGTNVLSEHGKGLAIDINPIENPYVGRTLLQPDAGARFRERSANVPGMIHEGDVVVAAFRRIGWSWGGAWSTARDYQHMSQSDR